MMNPEKRELSVLEKYPSVERGPIDAELEAVLKAWGQKIVVLDDDPTGVQTVHGVSVYTDWSVESISKGFDETNQIFFILTNSRGFTVEETQKAHIEIAQNVQNVSVQKNMDYILISRSDSTLRGHYPLETITLKNTLEAETGKIFDGEVIIPFFKEGGRFTIDNIHYVKEGDQLTPAGQTEFAKDKTFGYSASHLGAYCEEKTNGAYKAEDAVYISLDSIRKLEISKITDQLMSVTQFNKVIVNAIDYIDVKIFSIALVGAMMKGKKFMFRSAAALTKVLGAVTDKALLTKEDLVDAENKNGGIILVGSHVNKTTQQLEALMKTDFPIEFIEFHVASALTPGGLEAETQKIQAMVDEKISQGKTVAVYTSREKISLETTDKDEILKVSVAISDAVTSLIGNLKPSPKFIVAKGGITSSDVGTKALRVKKALVMGQIKPGIPVWMTGEESKFPHMPYVIFPGNVGEVTSLREIVETLMA